MLNNLVRVRKTRGVKKLFKKLKDTPENNLKRLAINENKLAIWREGKMLTHMPLPMKGGPKENFNKYRHTHPYPDVPAVTEADYKAPTQHIWPHLKKDIRGLRALGSVLFTVSANLVSGMAWPDVQSTLVQQYCGHFKSGKARQIKTKIVIDEINLFKQQTECTE